MPADRGTQIIEVPDYEGLLAKYEALQRDRDDIHKNLVAMRVAIGDMEKDRDKYKARIRVLEEEAKELQQELGCWESATGCGSHDKGADLIAALRRERAQLDNQLAGARKERAQFFADASRNATEREEQRTRAEKAEAELAKLISLVRAWSAADFQYARAALCGESDPLQAAVETYNSAQAALLAAVGITEYDKLSAVISAGGCEHRKELDRLYAPKPCADCDLTMPLDFAKICDACKNSLPHALWLLFTATPMNERRLAGEAIWHILTARNRQNDDRTELRSEIEHLQRVSKAAHERAEKAERIAAENAQANQISCANWERVSERVATLEKELARFQRPIDGLAEIEKSHAFNQSLINDAQRDAKNTTDHNKWAEAHDRLRQYGANDFHPTIDKLLSIIRQQAVEIERQRSHYDAGMKQAQNVVAEVSLQLQEQKALRERIEKLPRAEWQIDGMGTPVADGDWLHRSEVLAALEPAEQPLEKVEELASDADDMGNQIALVRDWWYRRSRAWKRSARGFRTKAKMFHSALLLAHKERDAARAALDAFARADTQPQIAGFMVGTGELVRLESEKAVPASESFGMKTPDQIVREKEYIRTLEARQVYDLPISISVISEGGRDVIHFDDGPEGWTLLPANTSTEISLQEVVDSMIRIIGRCSDSLVRQRDEAREKLEQQLAAAQGDREMRKELGDIMGGVSPKNPDKIPSWPLLHNTARGLRRLADQAGEGNSHLWKMVAAAVGDEWKKYHTAGTSMAGALCATIAGIRQRLAEYERPFPGSEFREIEARHKNIADSADLSESAHAAHKDRARLLDALRNIDAALNEVLKINQSLKRELAAEKSRQRNEEDTWGYRILVRSRRLERALDSSERKRAELAMRLVEEQKKLSEVEERIERERASRREAEGIAAIAKKELEKTQAEIAAQKNDLADLELERQKAAAEREALLTASWYALRRVGTDPDFRYHMLMTETMDRLCGAVAAASGKDPEALKKECSVDRQPEYRRVEPQLVVERKKTAELERLVDRIAAEAKIDWERLEALREEVKEP